MPSGPNAHALRHLRQLFQQGTVGGLPEWQLLQRYTTQQDEAAFEALVTRLGPMVLAVCRRILDDPHAVEDAFQATFLVLVRKAHTLGERDAIGPWLYGVAYRVALHARSQIARRRSREKQAVGGEWERGAAGDEPGRSELAAILDEELNRLPGKYRAPIVLCDLEGFSHEETARRLHWPVGTVKGRLSRARKLLRGRLVRRNVLPTAGLLATAFGREVSAKVPGPLVFATVRAALQASAGRGAVGVVSVTAMHLYHGVLSTMFMTKLKGVAAILGICGGLAVGAWTLAQSSRGIGVGLSAAADEKDAENREGLLRDALNKPMALKFQGTRLDEALKAIKTRTAAEGGSGVPIYVEPEGLSEAGVSLETPVTIDTTDAPLKQSIDRMLRPLKLAATTKDGLLVVTSRQEAAFIEMGKIEEQLKRLSGRPDAVSGQGETPGVTVGDASPAAWLNRVQGKRSAFYMGSDDETTPEDLARTRAILDALRMRIPMEFAHETELDEVLKHIKEKTRSDALPDGIPIYVEPVGLQEAEKTLTSPVTINLKGVALRESLRLILTQLGLTYSVKDGLLRITSMSSEDAQTPILSLAEKAERGELSVREMNDLIEIFTVRARVERLAAGEEGNGGNISNTPMPQTSGALTDVANPLVDTNPKTRIILSALDRAIPLHYKDVPIAQVIKDIQKATTGPGLPEGVPVYLAPMPIGARGVTIDLDKIRLKTSLRLLLRQLQMAYVVKDGLLIIDWTQSPEITPAKNP